MNKPTMMKCGCAANAVTENGKPVCVIHAGLDSGAYEIAETPNLSGRRARCSYFGHPPGRHHGPIYGAKPNGECKSRGYCDCETDSNLNLPFFAYKPDEEFDKFYCGCFGWD